MSNRGVRPHPTEVELPVADDGSPALSHTLWAAAAGEVEPAQSAGGR